MKKLKSISGVMLLVFVLFAFKSQAHKTNYKCMIQMTNYSGHGAYVVVSLINAQGDYEETLYVQGDDKDWFNTLEEWWKFYGKKRNDIDAITGATISGGERTISIISIEDSKVDTGYRIRFETAVEDQEYYTSDVEFPLTSENLKGKHEGKGFIRYIRIMPN